MAYHDDEWGVPVHDDRVFFEFLILEGAQGGSLLVDDSQQARRLPRRVRRVRSGEGGGLQVEGSRAAHGQSRDRAQPTQDRERDQQRQSFPRSAARVRHFRSLRLVVRARQAAPESATVDENGPRAHAGIDALSKDLQKRGFRFVGTTIIYAFMQATGLVNDHLVACPRWIGVQDAKAPR
jgi:DNA-3-methyladenine glycosylase I